MILNTLQIGDNDFANSSKSYTLCFTDSSVPGAYYIVGTAYNSTSNASSTLFIYLSEDGSWCSIKLDDDPYVGSLQETIPQDLIDKTLEIFSD